MNATQLPDIGTADAAALLKVTWKTANKWMHSGKLRAVKVGGRYRTTLQWIAEVAVPLPCLRPETSNGASDEHEATISRLKSRFGLKVSSAVMRKARRKKGSVPGVLCVPVAAGEVGQDDMEEAD